jgi:hypothetical protein
LIEKQKYQYQLTLQNWVGTYVGSPVSGVRHVTIPAIQRCAIENLLQADVTLAASVEPEGVREYTEIKKAALEFFIFYRGIAH